VARRNPEFGGSLLEQANLMLAMSFLVVLDALVHVFLPPPEHAIDQEASL
jgi:hypothetical protein